jgi:hypothetical protein
MRLSGGEDYVSLLQLPGNPERLEIRNGSAAAEMAEVRFPSHHPGELGDRLFLHRRARPPSIECVVVGIDMECEFVRKTCNGMRRLQHLAGIQWMEVRVVVLESGCNVEKNMVDPVGIP